MPTVDDDLQAITPEDLLLKPAFSLPVTVPELVEQEEPSGPDSISQFDARHREPFTGLLFLGYLKETETILGHTFTLETPDQGVRIETGLLHKKYLNVLSSEIAWAAVTVAAYLKKVDGTDLPQPIGPKDTGLTDRFFWVLDNLKGPVIQRVYEKCLLLDSKVNDAIAELERLGES